MDTEVTEGEKRIQNLKIFLGFKIKGKDISHRGHREHREEKKRRKIIIGLRSTAKIFAIEVIKLHFIRSNGDWWNICSKGAKIMEKRRICIMTIC